MIYFCKRQVKNGCEHVLKAIEQHEYIKHYEKGGEVIRTLFKDLVTESQQD